MAQQYDIVVAGGGHNGLNCAAYLLKAGLKSAWWNSRTGRRRRHHRGN